jgi:anaerobic selenocysteine-containing dehydrogenase
MQRAFAFSYTIGSTPSCDYQNCDLVILWGRQPFYSGPAMSPARDYLDAKKRGAVVVAIKPSVEPDAGMADIWVPLRPGTDAALALSMLHVIINENLIDEAFVRHWCTGYDELKAHIRQYPPAWGETVTGVPAGQIEAVARLYATTKKALIDLGNGVEHAPSSSDAIRAVAILMAVTGHLDRPGCNLLGPPGGGMTLPRSVSLQERYTPEMVSKLVGPEFPMPFQPFFEGTSSAYYRILDSVLTEKPYPVRTIFAPGTQPTVSTRGTKRVIEALKKVDFYVVIDVMRTADMDFADIVLPTTTPYETDHPFETRADWVMARNRVIKPLGDYKSIYEFFLELGVRMGYGADFWDGDIAAMQDFQLSGLKLTLDELRACPVGKAFDAPGGRTYENYARAFSRRTLRLDKAPFLPDGKGAIYNATFEKEGYAPLPEWREAPESPTGTPELLGEFPLMLSDYHTSKNFTAAWQRNVPVLRETEPYPLLHIHPETASGRGIADGDWVRVRSPHGYIKVKAALVPGIRPDTVMLLHGWWQGCRELGLEDMPLVDGGANVNVLYSVDPDKAYDPLITAMTSQTLVEVSRYE